METAGSQELRKCDRNSYVSAFMAVGVSEGRLVREKLPFTWLVFIQWVFLPAWRPAQARIWRVNFSEDENCAYQSSVKRVEGAINKNLSHYKTSSAEMKPHRLYVVRYWSQSRTALGSIAHSNLSPDSRCWWRKLKCCRSSPIKDLVLRVSCTEWQASA